jgi:threonine aldolase
MRQTGILAGCAAYGLTNNFPKLPAVHALAQKLEKGLEELGCAVPGRAETCMVRF